MARVKLDLPERVDFTTEIAIRIGDINYGGHLGNDAVLSLIHEARCRFLVDRGLSENDLGGVGMVLTDCIIQYQSEAFYGETLRVDIAVDDFSRIGFDLYYRLCEAGDGREVARAKTAGTCFDWQKRKAAALPEGLEGRLRR
jgi:4-hydroxybenzoyl-CoA thioesterase